MAGLASQHRLERSDCLQSFAEAHEFDSKKQLRSDQRGLERRCAPKRLERLSVAAEFVERQPLVGPYFSQLRVESQDLVVELGRLGEVAPLFGLPGALEQRNDPGLDLRRRVLRAGGCQGNRTAQSDQ